MRKFVISAAQNAAQNRAISAKRNYQPGEELLPYQRNWADDASRWKFGLMARQVGKDFASAFEGIRHCIAADLLGRSVQWLIAAPSERQSLESLYKWKRWAECSRHSLADFNEVREKGSQSLLKSASITFPNGSRVIAVPGKPDTVRGFSANVLLTEFAFFEDPDATWRALLPSITNPMSGGVKKVRLITTPNGIGNKAYDLWVKNYNVAAASPPLSDPQRRHAAATWSCHFVDIHTAVKHGLRVNLQELKTALDDPEGWAQEFECQFLDAHAVLLPYELIASCESLEATETIPPNFWVAGMNSAQPLFLGIDFGRARDLTVCWTLEPLGDVLHTREVLPLEKMPTPEQVELLKPRIRRATRVCLDYTGPGIGLGDYLAKEFSEYDPRKHKYGKIELCNFTNTLKLELFSKLRMAFEKRALRVPVSRTIREDLHSVNRVTSPTGQVTYRAPHSADGHADRCDALALALRAAAQAGPIRCSSQSIRVRPSIGDWGLGRFRPDQWPM